MSLGNHLPRMFFILLLSKVISHPEAHLHLLFRLFLYNVLCAFYYVLFYVNFLCFLLHPCRDPCTVATIFNLSQNCFNLLSSFKSAGFCSNLWTCVLTQYYPSIVLIFKNDLDFSSVQRTSLPSLQCSYSLTRKNVKQRGKPVLRHFLELRAEYIYEYTLNYIVQ